MVSRITVWMIQANEVQIVETSERCEAWTVKDGTLHALMLSCPLDKRKELEKVIKDIKDSAGGEPWTVDEAEQQKTLESLAK